MRYQGEDRRHYARSRRGVETVSDDGGPGVLNHIDNVSGNGILCHTVKPVPLMTKMIIALQLPRPAERRIECEGIVVRCDPDEKGDDHFKVAILYTHISDADRLSLEDFVAHDLAQPDAEE